MMHTDQKIRSGADFLPPRPLTAKQKASALAAMTEEERIKTRCCFLGLAPEKIRRPVDDVKIDLENEILAAIKEGYTTFITGIMQGTEIWAGNIVVRLKDRFPDLKLIAVLPFPECTESWDNDWKLKGDSLLAKADLVKIISSDCSVAAYSERICWMASHASRMIAVSDGISRSTGESIRYARERHLAVRILRG